MEHVQAVILDNHRVTTVVTAAKVGFTVSVGLTHATVYDKLEFNKVCSRQEHKQLTDQLKQNRVNLPTTHETIP